jgi:carboxypeptidase C (cathepsin A)
MEEEKKATTAEDAPAGKDFWAAKASATLPVPEPASLRMSWQAHDAQIDYLTTAGHLDVRQDTGKLTAQMFYLSYIAVDGEGKADPTRPLTFLFNGGPACASVPIDFGGFGPLRVKTNGTSHLAASAAVEDNPHTLLKHSDLVFLDAPGTGFSPVATDADPKALFGIDGDADAFCRAITDYLEREGRWESPLYLLGESYGTTRNAVLMRLLGERGVKLTGVTMLSAIWDWVQTLPGEDLYYLGMLPTFAATAQFFGRAGVGVDEDVWFDQAMEFTEDVYAPALLRGDRLGAEREREVAARISSLIGLPADFIAQRHLRVSLEDFRARLLADEGKLIGRLDMRFVADAPGYAQQSVAWLAGEDAADDAVNAVWNRAFRSLLTRIGYKAPARYLDNNYDKVGVNWDWMHEGPGTLEGKVGTPNVAIDIACALRRDPTIKLCILGGRYDAATTWWNVEHDLSAQFLSPALKERVEWHRYGCGHMAYVDEPTLVAMDADLAAFYAKA